MASLKLRKGECKTFVCLSCGSEFDLARALDHCPRYEIHDHLEWHYVAFCPFCGGDQITPERFSIPMNPPEEEAAA